MTDSKDAFDFFYTWTCRDPGVPAPTTVAEMAYYLCDTSAKTSYLARLLADIVYKRREKLIIWAHEPLTLFVTELFLWIVGIEPMAIRPGVKSSQRIRAMQDFNNNPRRRVLLLADRTAQESMNLQAACHNMVAMDAVDNGSKSQMTGRIHRVGQQHVCRAFFLNTDETIDQRIEAQYWLRARTITASQLELDDDLLKDLEARLSEADIIQMTKEVNASPQSISKRHYLTKRFREAVVDAAQREEWGVRSTRDGAWLNETDFEAKNLEPQERLFRMAYGGRVADRLAYQVRCTRREPEAEKKQEKYEALDPQEAHRYVAVKVPENCWAVEPPLFHAKDVPVVTQAEAVVLIVQAGCAAARKLFKYGATPYGKWPHLPPTELRGPGSPYHPREVGALSSVRAYSHMLSVQPGRSTMLTIFVVMLDGARRQVARPSRHISAAIAIVKQMGLAEVTDISDLDWEDCEIEEELKQYNRDPVLYRQQFEAKEGGADAMTVDDPRDSHQSDLTEHDSPTRRDLDGNGTGEDDSEGEEEGGSGTEDEESADEDASDVAGKSVPSTKPNSGA